MRRIIPLIILLMGMPLVVNAAELEGAIRLDRNKSGSTPLPILITIKPITSAVENNFKITAGNGYNVDIDAGNITTSVGGLPLGITAWPGISSATNINGKTIIFPSGDLVVGTVYGFYITGGIGVNPSYLNKWIIQTANGGEIIDQAELGLTGVTNDQVSVTGKVGAKSADFQLDLSAGKTGELNIGDEVAYTINYGSYLQNFTKPLVISAEWSRGTIEGAPVPSVDIVDYVIGSGSLGYGGVTPVIDLLNRRIIWTISSFPANTVDQNVSFKLKVNGSYTGNSRMAFDVVAYLSGANVVTTNKSVGNVYKPLAPSSTVTPTSKLTVSSPTATSTSSAGSSVVTVAPSLTPAVVPIKLIKIEVATLTDSRMEVSVESNSKPSQMTIRFGESAGLLNKSITSINGLLADLLTLDDLVPGKNYYFKISIKSIDGQSASSDIYTFRTALMSDAPVVDPKSVVISVDNNVVLDASEEKEATNSVVLLPEANYAFRVNLSKYELIKSVKIFIKNSHVLGITTVYGAEPNSTMVDLTEIVNGGFVGHLVSPTITGYYDIDLRIEDLNGNIVQSKVGQMRVTDPIQVIDENNKPIENAKIIIYKFDLRKKIYEMVTRESLGVLNPSFTEPDGKIFSVLPKGKYRIEVSSIGYVDQTVDFVVGIGAEENNPRVVLNKSKPSFADIVKLYGAIINDVWGFTQKYAGGLIFSNRFLALINILVYLSLIVIIVCRVAGLLMVQWWLLPKKLIGKIFSKDSKGKIIGVVADEESRLPLAQATIYLMDGKKNKVLTKSTTDILGEFVLDIIQAKSYKIMVTKSGYESGPMLDYSIEGLTSSNLVLMLQNEITMTEFMETKVLTSLNRLISFLFSVWLMVALILEIGFSIHFGMTVVWLPMVISWLCLALWLTKQTNDKN